jgi:signal transduction histidine kinase
MSTARRDLLVALALVLIAELELQGRPDVSVVGAMGLLLVALRWWRPGAVLLALCVLLTADAWAGGVLVADLLAPLAAVAWLVSGVGARSRRPVAVLCCAFAVAALTTGDQLGAPGRYGLLNDVAFYVIAVAAPAVVGWILSERARQVDDLFHLTRTLEVDRDLPAELARAAEAEQLGRAVDAALAEQIRALVSAAERAEQLVVAEPYAALEIMGQVERQARQVLDELRSVIGTLRVSPPDEQAAPRSSPIASSHRTSLTATASTVERGVRWSWADALLAATAVPVAVEVAVASPAGWPLVVGLAGCAALAVLLAQARRRPLPVSVLLVLLIVTLNEWATPLTSTVTWLAPPLILGYVLGAHATRGRSLVGLGILGSGVASVTLLTAPGSRDWSSLAPTLTLTLGAWLCGRLVRRRGQRADLLTELARDLEAGRRDRARLAVAHERLRAARELHDVGAHAMTVICLQAGAAQRVWERHPELGLEAVRTVAAVSRSTLTELSRTLSLRALHSPRAVLDPGQTEALVELGRGLGLSLQVTVTGPPQLLSQHTGQVAYRVVQEALTNVARHASRSRVEVRLRYAADQLAIEIQNRGAAEAGGRTQRSGLGLTGMRERVEGCRGHLTYGPTSEGFLVRATLPTGTSA